MSQRNSKEIFKYFNGAEEVWGDPMPIYRKLVSLLDGDPDRVMAESESEVPQVAAQAEERLVAAVREAFEMVPYNKKAEREEEAGATEKDCFAALGAYAAFCEKKSPNADPSPTSTAPLEKAPPLPTSDATSTMETPLDCGCT